MFSIIIPTWNNLAYVKLCVESIEKNSAYHHQIILHINDGSDGSLQFAKEKKITHTYSRENIGICLAVNQAAANAQFDLLLYMNDDMYCLPGWDIELLHAVNNCETDLFMLSSTMIEPVDTGNQAVIHANFGNSISTFTEQQLLDNFAALDKQDWFGSCWPPNIVHRKHWQTVGGYSIEFSPGMSSDDDFAMKMWQIGCRHFKGIGNSRVYHFQTKSTARIKKNNGAKQFLQKWGITQSFFNKCYIRKGTDFKETEQLAVPVLSVYEKMKILYKKAIY